MNEDQEKAGREALPQEVTELLYSYLAAFSNLYGIAPLYRVLSTFQKQNPEIGLTEEQFLSFVDGISVEEQIRRNYIIVGEEDIYQDVSKKTPPLRREIVAEYLYAIDDFESYEALKEEQRDKPYYLPPKEELLKYEDEGYFEKTPEYWALSEFLQEKLKVQNVWDTLDDLHWQAHMDPPNAEHLIYAVNRLERRNCFPTEELIEEFLQLFLGMYKHTRLNANRGFTPNDLGREMKWKPVAVKPENGKKVGRNDPCPCGSGKKYKKCCGR